MKTIKIANYDQIYNEIYNDNDRYNKVTKLANKVDAHPYWYLLEKLAKKIGTGAVRMDGWWHPVTNGKVDRRDSYQFSTAAAQVAAQGAAVKNEIQHITSI